MSGAKRIIAFENNVPPTQNLTDSEQKQTWDKNAFAEAAMPF